MLAQNSRRGAAVAIVVAVIALVVIAFGAWYLISDPFHQKVKEGFNQATKWTADNIKKDPAGYLGWALEQVDVTKGKLEAAQLALSKQKIDLTNRLEKIATEKSQYESLLPELKDAWETTTKYKKWPVTVRHVTIEDESALKRKIVEANANLERASKLVDTYKSANDKVTSRLDEIESQLSKVEQLKIKLNTDLETAKAQQSFEGIDAVSTNFNDILATSEALSKTADRNSSVSDMIKPSGEAHIDDEFEKIMGKGKDKDAGAKDEGSKKDPAGK